MFPARTHSLVCLCVCMWSKAGVHGSLFISTDSCFCLRTAVVFKALLAKNKRQHLKRGLWQMNALFSHFELYLPVTPPVISSCQGSAFFLFCLIILHVVTPSLSLSHSLISTLPYSSWLAVCVVISLEGSRRTNKVFVCPRRGTRDRLGWRRCSQRW